MAVLTNEEKAKIRNAVEKIANQNGVSIDYVKGAINDSAQAIEDALVSMKTAVSSDIDNASSTYGVTFTNQQKRWIAAKVMELCFVRDWVT